MPRWTPEARKRQSDLAWMWWGNHDKHYRNPERKRGGEINEAIRSRLEYYGRCKKLDRCICGMCHTLIGERIVSETNITKEELMRHPLWQLLESESQSE